MVNCSPTSTTSATTPCANDRSMVANVDPSATVTTKSKAFILERVRLPVILRTRITAAYASIPITAVRARAAQPPKRRESMDQSWRERMITPV